MIKFHEKSHFKKRSNNNERKNNTRGKIDVTCVYYFALGAEALANGDKKKALEYAEKSGVDLLS